MTTFLGKTASYLASHAVAPPLTIYGLHRMFPVPNVGFLAIASAMTLCTTTTIANLGRDCARKLTDRYERKDMLFYQLNSLSTLSVEILLPIFARYVGQRMGIEVPGYLKTLGYFSLAGKASWAVKPLCEILSDTYYSYYPKPATK